MASAGYWVPLDRAQVCYNLVVRVMIAHGATRPAPPVLLGSAGLPRPPSWAGRGNAPIRTSGPLSPHTIAHHTVGLMSKPNREPRPRMRLSPVLLLILLGAVFALPMGGCNSSLDPINLRSDNLPPQVSQTTPTRDAVGVSTRTTITVTFNEAMDAATIHYVTFQVSVGGDPVDGTVVGLGRRFTFDPESQDLPVGRVDVMIDGVADAAGNRIAAPYAFGFSTGSGPAPPPVPSNPYPAAGAIDIPSDTTFTWEGGSANTYDFFLGTSPGNMSQRATGLTTESFEPGPLPYLTTHYWQVIAHSGDLETGGPIWVFTTQANPNPANQPPRMPCSPQPPDVGLNVSVNTSLSWGCLGDPDDDDVTYEVYLGTNLSPPLVAEVSGPPYTPAAPLNADTIYRWRIIADDGRGGRTAGAVWTFRTAAAPPANDPPSEPAPPIMPPNNSTTAGIDVDLSWSGGDDPDGDPVTYEVRFGTVNPPTPSTIFVTSKTHQVQGLAFETRYFWRIVARDDHKNETAGPVWHFDTPQPPPVNQPPSVPCTPQPSDNAQDVLLAITLTWGCGVDPESDPVEYDVYFEKNDSDPDHIVATVTQRSYSASNLDPNATYYWRIVARDDQDAASSGPVWSFTTQSRPPTAPCNPNPADGAILVSPSNVILQWSCGVDPDGDGDGGAVTFDVYFGNTPDPPLVQEGLSERQYQVGGLDALTTYYWRIVAVSDDDGAETSGPVWSFETGVVNQN